MGLFGKKSEAGKETLASQTPVFGAVIAMLDYSLISRWGFLRIRSIIKENF